MKPQLPPLDLHAHIDPKTPASQLERLGAVVFAATRSLAEYRSVKERNDQVTVWGVGCHPGVARALEEFHVEIFAGYLVSTGHVSEVGMDQKSEVPMSRQLAVFETILGTLQHAPRITSIHSAGAPDLVLDALQEFPIKGAVLHWWRGNAEQTRRAVELGCWFSVNAAGLRAPDKIAAIPLDRILTETDHPYGDRRSPTPRQPGAVSDVENRLSQFHGVTPSAMHAKVWRNFQNLVDETNVEDFMPLPVQRMLAAAK